MKYIIRKREMGAADGDRKPLLTRQIAFDPLPASVFIAFILGCFMVMEHHEKAE